MNTATKLPDIAPAPPSAEQQLKLAFAPLDKRAFGAAIGIAIATVVFAVTVFHVIVQPAGPEIGLLRFYFYGYSVSWPGAFIGAFWSFVAGFVAGWFVAFCRNFVIAVSVFLTRARAELQATRDFLDHI
jgi:hypothetical protein